MLSAVEIATCVGVSSKRKVQMSKVSIKKGSKKRDLLSRGYVSTKYIPLFAYTRREIYGEPEETVFCAFLLRDLGNYVKTLRSRRFFLSLHRKEIKVVDISRLGIYWQ